MRDFEPAYVGSGSKRESPILGLMSASTSYGHRRGACRSILGRSWHQPIWTIALNVMAITLRGRSAGHQLGTLIGQTPVAVLRADIAWIVSTALSSVGLSWLTAVIPPTRCF